MNLPTEWIACLRDAAGGVMSLQGRWMGDGERTLRPHYGRLGGSWHTVPVVIGLCRAGLLEGADDTCATLRVSDHGAAWLQAHPAPAADPHPPPAVG